MYKKRPRQEFWHSMKRIESESQHDDLAKYQEWSMGLSGSPRVGLRYQRMHVQAKAILSKAWINATSMRDMKLGGR